MADAPDWPKVLSLTVHEFRTPLTVVAGYLRMLSTDRVGPLSDAQRRVIQEAERSCGRLSSLLTEVSEVAHFHQGRLTFMRSRVPLDDILRDVGPTAPSEAPLAVEREGDARGATVDGDAARLRAALSAVATAIAREIMDGPALYVLTEVRERAGRREAFIAMGGERDARAIIAADTAALPAFDTARGGNGLSLVVARQVLEDHGASLHGAPGDHPRAGAGISLPLSN